ncbi:MAG: helix-turn-helix transcriptional regulator [Nanoarchaeota archaeon]|nr:helix-turn-helix transcriptional regulator [Nanoarchaeota archaeon]
MKSNIFERVREIDEKRDSDIVEAYANGIREVYERINHSKLRSKFFEKLESLVDSIEPLALFDPNKAREQRGGMTATELSVEIDVSQQVISNYEIGESIPYSGSKSGRNYLEWLKTKGYNPFEI